MSPTTLVRYVENFSAILGRTRTRTRTSRRRTLPPDGEGRHIAIQFELIFSLITSMS